MPKQIQLRRGTTTQHATFTGAEGEVTMDTRVSDYPAIRLGRHLLAGQTPARPRPKAKPPTPWWSNGSWTTRKRRLRDRPDPG